jgi:sugar phosphate isomerase/epimerase
MIKPGICSITFRRKSPEEVIALMCDAGLDGIEWGSDIHVLLNDLKNAGRVGQLTRDAGLSVAGYGSYYFAFDKEGEAPSDFSPVLDAAAALGAPVIRIWGGSLTMEKSDDYFLTVVERTRQAAEAAVHANIKIAYEFGLRGHSFHHATASAMPPYRCPSKIDSSNAWKIRRNP